MKKRRRINDFSLSPELYQQVLAKALAHYFEAKLLLLDLTDFSLKVQSKYCSGNKEYSFKRSTSESTLEKLSDLFGSFSIFQQREEPKVAGKLHRQSSGMDLQSMCNEASCNPPKLRRNTSSSSNISGLTSQSNPTNSDLVLFFFSTPATSSRTDPQPRFMLHLVEAHLWVISLVDLVMENDIIWEAFT
ncbi:hypothetical protein P8452_52504 [Trifolium repens]|nr:hypothetical protein P8452_26143 [Trifolium repens]WJX55543.1 hypothetical protein P8452_41308 [Trifolium repens]WJX68101.1 hypothetical protein P8452_52504 [Trifolium repens]